MCPVYSPEKYSWGGKKQKKVKLEFYRIYIEDWHGNMVNRIGGAHTKKLDFHFRIWNQYFGVSFSWWKGLLPYFLWMNFLEML